MEQFVLITEEFELPHHRHQLREDGGDSGSLYSPFEHDDEKCIQYHVHHHREDGGVHSLPRLAGCPEQRIHAEIHVAHHITQQDDDHIVTCIDECLVAGSEESQNRVEEEQTDHAQSDTDDEIQRNCVTQNVLGCSIILLSQLHADGC